MDCLSSCITPCLRLGIVYKAVNITPSVYNKTKGVSVVGLETFLTETEMLKREKRNKCVL